MIEDVRPFIYSKYKCPYCGFSVIEEKVDEYEGCNRLCIKCLTPMKRTIHSENPKRKVL